jgi:phthalate 4,5-dioxygenase oxygenase subunit
VESLEVGYGRGADDFIPGTYKLKAGPENDYMIDRQAQKTQSFTGITGINTQDMALQEGMGAIVDRTKEFLGTSDTAIIAMRKILLEATHMVERGEAPPGIEPAGHGGVRPHDGVVPPGADWRQSFAEELAAKW